MSLREDMELCEKAFADTHDMTDSDSPDFVTRAEAEQMLRKGLVNQERQEIDPIGLSTECPHCHRTIVIDGIEGDELFKAMNQTLGHILDRLEKVEAYTSLNETIVKGIAGFKVLGDELSVEIEELRKGLDEITPDHSRILETGFSLIESEPVAKGITMDMSPKQKRAIDKLGNLTQEEWQAELRKAVNEGRVSADVEAYAASCTCLADLIANPSILAVLDGIE